ncbi:MAG: peptidoglycan DD-metalloendopeptidase family protein [Bradymonadales bacterium]|nr:peptidoglycan DD-metalloendopeptidase family protein [Bradymonadales bacterium]
MTSPLADTPILLQAASLLPKHAPTLDNTLTAPCPEPRQSDCGSDTDTRALPLDVASSTAVCRVAQALDRAASTAITPSFPRLRGTLQRPVAGAVLAGFGPMRRTASFTLVRHPGVTYQVAQGSAVRAVASGIVRHVGWLNGYGQVVIIDHGQGYYSVYGFVGDCLRGPGDLVRPGERLGTTRLDGQGGEQLYFEIRHRRQPLDPADWIDLTAPN